MLSKSAVIAVLTLSAGLLLAQVANAETFKGTFRSRCTDINIAGLLSFDGSNTSLEAQVRCSSKSSFPTNPSFGGASNIDGVTELSVVLSTSCSFTGVFGEAEAGVKTKLVGAVFSEDKLLGSLFFSGTSGSGCFSPTTGAFTFTQSNALFAGTGVFEGATGSGSYTLTGFTLGPPPAAGAFGFFQWSKADGKETITLP
jgi:hypothetical protein